MFPVALGSAAALSERVGFDLTKLALSVVVVGSLHLAAIFVSDFFDHRAGTDKLARLDRSAIPTGSLPLEDGTLQPNAVLVAAAVLVALALAATAAIGEPFLWRLVIGALALAMVYAGPPFRLAYVGMGLGDLAVLLCYGPLAVAGAYTAATGWSAPTPVLFASLPVGGFVSMAYASHHFLHWRADKAAAKRTIVVVLGEHGALIAIGIVDVLAWGFLVAAWSAGSIPATALAGLLGVPVVLSAWRAAWIDPLPQAYLRLIGAHLAAAAMATLALVAAFAATGPRP